ncbi:MAG: hypothetical protein AAGA93_26140 [Actinomycetota bacterium]
MTSRRATVRAVATAFVAALGLSACGQPTAQLIKPDDTRISYEVPIDFEPLLLPGQPSEREQYGPPGAEISESSSEPLLSLTSIGSGDQASFMGLRMLATAGQFDPLDDDPTAMPEGMQLLGYSEISEPEIWGVRLQFILGPTVADYQALVDRRTNRIAISEVFCTQACFVEQQDLIDQIQRSWRLEP